MSVTIKEIAEKSGVSIVTASRILNNQGQKHREETRQRVLSTASLLGYRVNSSARAMRSGRFDCVALLLSRRNSSFSMIAPGLLDGIHDALAERNQHLLVTRLSDEVLSSEAFVPKLLRESAADGLLINYNADIPPRLIDLVARYRLPAVWINSKHEADCVYPDDIRAGREAVEYLYSLGHRRIAYVDFAVSVHYSSADRLEGYVSAMRERGLSPRVLRPEPRAAAREYLPLSHGLLGGPDRPTAIFTYTPHMIPTLLMAAHREGLSVPGDLTLLTVDTRTSEQYGVRIGIMVLPEVEIGRIAVETLLKKVEDPTRRFAPCPVPLGLDPGESCAPPPAGMS